MINNLSNKKPWHRTIGGRIFLLLIGIIILLATALASLVGYYSWQIKFGDSEKLAQKFNSQAAANQSAQNLAAATQQKINSLIRPFNPSIGAENPSLTILVFIDYTCPYCQGTFPVFKSVVENYEPTVRWVIKHFPLNLTSSDALGSSLAGLCAEEQNKYWEYHNLLFANKIFDEAALIDYAAQAGLNKTKFADCLKSKKYLGELEQDLKDAVDLGIHGTPTYLVGNQIIEGALTEDKWNEIILGQL
jgi:protein-disulfide isomerase